MSLFEKIAFLESFFKLFEVNHIFQLNSESEIDILISKVSNQLKSLKDVKAKLQIDEMPLFYN
mgnify:CR=1 FL=1